MASELFAVIMAGGSGTRFWPASRRDLPKQFLPIAGGRPMILETFERIADLIPPENVLVVTAESQSELVRKALPDLPEPNLIAEPEPKNTAPCVALAAFEIRRRAGDALQVVLPADHVIEPREEFHDTLRAAFEEARASRALVTFGIVPTFPATGYGYIERGARQGVRGVVPVYAVQRFVEKPDREKAEEFLASGRFLWNSGMFAWTTDAILEAIQRHLPEVGRGLDRLGEGVSVAEVYAEMPAVSVDVGVMERATSVRVLPIDYRWSDVGSWAALPEVLEPDAAGNVSALGPGAVLVAEDARDCIAYAENEEVIALVGVSDLVVVRAGNATLVCPRERAQEVKRIVERLGREDPRFL